MNLFNILIDKMNYLLHFQKKVILLILSLKEVYKLLKKVYKIHKKYKDMNTIINRPFKINPNNVLYVEKILN